ncbi:MAG: 50S ribosomal protein L25 [Candidatus Pacebacteria bacterium]|nr:50S ribosomal protein L25 [Candidatus Paceibacterota bacterium]
MFVINAKKRDDSQNLAHLRKGGQIPAVFYGAGKENTSIVVPTIEFKKVWRQAGESSAVVVKTEGGDVDVLIHEVQVDPVTDEPIHVDFLAIDMKKKINVNVPLVFEGISGAVKAGLGNLVKVLHEVEVEALPKDLPQNLVVDLSKLATVEDTIFVSDIKVPAGVEVIASPEDVVASIVLQKEEVEETVPVDLSAIEVEKKGKKEEEGAEGGEEAPAKE